MGHPTRAPGSLVLHQCGGRIRVWRNPGADRQCVCGAPFAGDVPFRAGHAAFDYPACGQRVGCCAAQLLTEVADGAALYLAAVDRMRRRAEGSPDG